jgi:AcrR family transcriptional regulator
MKARRVPTQERAKKRVEAILDAAAEIFVEVGYDSATVDGIAERAGTSVGSIYQFFPNKQALFEALADRCIERSKLIFETVLTPDVLAGGWETILSELLRAYYEWERTDLTAQALYRNLHLYGIFEAADRAMTQELIGQTSQLLAIYTDLPPKRRKIVATTAVNAATSFLFYARQEKDTVGRKLLEETELMLIRYLREYVREK